MVLRYQLTCRRLTLQESTPTVVLRYQLTCRRLTLEESTPTVVLRYQLHSVDDIDERGSTQGENLCYYNRRSLHTPIKSGAICVGVGEKVPQNWKFQMW